ASVVGRMRCIWFIIATARASSAPSIARAPNSCTLVLLFASLAPVLSIGIPSAGVEHGHDRDEPDTNPVWTSGAHLCARQVQTGARAQGWRSRPMRRDA